MKGLKPHLKPTRLEWVLLVDSSPLTHLTTNPGTKLCFSSKANMVPFGGVVRFRFFLEGIGQVIVRRFRLTNYISDTYSTFLSGLGWGLRCHRLLEPIHR
jgi:hypothetical protein